MASSFSWSWITLPRSASPDMVLAQELTEDLYKVNYGQYPYARLQRLLSKRDLPVVLLCATNQPLDDLAEQAFGSMDPELCTVVRLCSASWYRTLNEQSSGSQKPAHQVFVDSGNPKDSLKDKKKTILLTTLPMAAKTRVHDVPVIPSGWSRWIFLDESQSAECQE